jgi:hypothetical protein
MNNVIQMTDDERLVALFGLAASKRQQSQLLPCPSDEQLAELIDDSLNHKQRTTMLSHLNQCNECYQLWLETSSLLLEEKDLIEVVEIEHIQATG